MSRVRCISFLWHSNLPQKSDGEAAYGLSGALQEAPAEDLLYRPGTSKEDGGECGDHEMTIP